MPTIEPIKVVEKVRVDMDLNEAADLLQVISHLSDTVLNKDLGLSKQFRGRIRRIQDSLESVDAVIEVWENRIYKGDS